MKKIIAIVSIVVIGCVSGIVIWKNCQSNQNSDLSDSINRNISNDIAETNINTEAINTNDTESEDALFIEKKNNDDDDDIEYDGSFNEMTSIFKNKYEVTVSSEERGCPTGDSFFFISFSSVIADEKIWMNISFYDRYGKVEDEYEEYNSMKEAIIGGITYKYFVEGENVILLYKVDDEFYIRVDLDDAVQYDSEGMLTELTYTPEYLLTNAYLDEFFSMEIIIR